MRVLKKRFLILAISCLVLASCNQSMLVQVKKYNYSDLPQISSSLNQNTQKFKTNLTIYGIALTGILVVKKESSESILVSFVNEFGIKYFDARINNSNPEILYCIKQLDKKLVTNVLVHDFAVLFLSEAELNRSVEIFELGKLHYQFNQNENGTLKVEEYRKSNKISEFIVIKNGDIEVKHKKPEMSISLKHI